MSYNSTQFLNLIEKKAITITYEKILSPEDKYLRWYERQANFLSFTFVELTYISLERHLGLTLEAYLQSKLLKAVAEGS